MHHKIQRVCSVISFLSLLLASSPMIAEAADRTPRSLRGVAANSTELRCEAVDALIASDSAKLKLALENPSEVAQKLASGQPLVEDLSGAFMMAAAGNKITAKACRTACMGQGVAVDICRAACGQLKNGTCCGLWALFEHLSRHGQKKPAEAILAAYTALCKTGNRN